MKQSQSGLEPKKSNPNDFFLQNTTTSVNKDTIDSNLDDEKKQDKSNFSSTSYGPSLFLQFKNNPVINGLLDQFEAAQRQLENILPPAQ